VLEQLRTPNASLHSKQLIVLADRVLTPRDVRGLLGLPP